MSRKKSKPAKPAKPAKREALPTPPLNPNGRVMYFAFGSNLDEQQMAERCPDALPLWPASLEGYRIEFVGFSRGWGGGVATIVPDDGGVVEGYVYDMTPADVRKLDAREGAPYVYSRDVIAMADEDGTEHHCITYVHNRPQDLTKPSLAYARQIAQAYEAEGFDPQPLLAAIARAPRRKAPTVRKRTAPKRKLAPPRVDALPDNVIPMRKPIPRPQDLPGFALAQDDAPSGKPHLVFVYGSLMHGMSNHVVMESIDADFYGEDALPAAYHMLDACRGAWPGVMPGGTTEVEGELYFVDDAGLARLDRLEGAPDLFTRRRVRTQTGDRAWVYTLNPEHARGCTVVTSGSWRTYKATLNDVEGGQA